MEKTHYLMTPYQALDLARNAEIQRRTITPSVADNTANGDVRKLGWNSLRRSRARRSGQQADRPLSQPEKGWDFDPDPPTIPE